MLFNILSKFELLKSKKSNRIENTKSVNGIDHTQCLRFLLIIINALGILLGLVAILYSFRHVTFFYESVVRGDGLTPQIVIVTLGFILFSFSLLGFVSSWKKKVFLLKLYYFSLTLVVVILLLFMLVDLKKMMKYISIPVWYYATHPAFEKEIDYWQIKFNCCGSDTYLDYIGMDFNSEQSTTVAVDHIDGDLVAIVLPHSCCAVQGKKICETMRFNSCKDAVYDFIQNRYILLIAFFIIFIQVLCIVFAYCIAHCRFKITKLEPNEPKNNYIIKVVK